MIKRSREEWFAHFEAQALSGQSMQSYCQLHGLCNRHFSQRRKQLGWHVEEKITRTHSGICHERFVPVQVQSRLPVSESGKVVLSCSGLRLECPAEVSASWLVEVMKGLS